jgi:chitosanase
MLTELQIKTAQAIVNIFETGHPQGDYGRVTVLPHDSGHLTYGRAQTTLASGNLYLLIKDYCETPEAQFAIELHEYLERLRNRDTSLDRNGRLKQLLRRAGEDVVMQEVQDRFFDRVYWFPSAQAANALGIRTALGTAVVYDSRIHGSWARMRDRTMERHGPVRDLGEEVWVSHYVTVRAEWLSTHPNLLLRKTVYRMGAFRKLIDQGRWSLDLPLFVRGMQIDEDVLGARPVRVSAQEVEERLLLLQTPFMQGHDVMIVQQTLITAGFSIRADGVFGPRTEAALKQFQTQHGLKADGIVGPATRLVLGLA